MEGLLPMAAGSSRSMWWFSASSYGAVGACVGRSGDCCRADVQLRSAARDASTTPDGDHRGSFADSDDARPADAGPTPIELDAPPA
jgi:hypothetical protein